MLLLPASPRPRGRLPAPDVSLVPGALAFRNHEGGPTDAPDWPVFLEVRAETFPETGAP